MGDPQDSENELRILEAARLGGAADFIKSFPDEFNTFLDNHMDVTISSENADALYDRVSRQHIKPSVRHGLSGGQMQRFVKDRFVWNFCIL